MKSFKSLLSAVMLSTAVLFSGSESFCVNSGELASDQSGESESYVDQGDVDPLVFEGSIGGSYSSFMPAVRGSLGILYFNDSGLCGMASARLGYSLMQYSFASSSKANVPFKNGFLVGPSLGVGYSPDGRSSIIVYGFSDFLFFKPLSLNESEGGSSTSVDSGISMIFGGGVRVTVYLIDYIALSGYVELSAPYNVEPPKEYQEFFKSINETVINPSFGLSIVISN